MASVYAINYKKNGLRLIGDVMEKKYDISYNNKPGYKVR